MPATPTTQQMGEKHEEDLARALGGAKTRGSGAAHQDADGAHHHDNPFAFRWDGKSTKGKQIAITDAMIEKIEEQAGGERPAIPLRWYGNEALTEVKHDWIAVSLADFTELLEAADSSLEFAEKCAQALQERDEARDEAERLREEVQALRERLKQASDWKVTQANVYPGGLGGPAIPGYIPMLPWTVIHAVHTAGVVKHVGLHYEEDGRQTTFDVHEARVERSLGSANRPRLMVNHVRVSQGALYVDGVLRTLVCAGNREIEVG